jgi:osmotically inducible lipoprotein OsmB
MRLLSITAIAAATVALAACETQETRTVIVTPSTPAALTAEVIAADSSWTVVRALPGATAGTLVARNTATGSCAFAVGDGTYRVGTCA